MEGMGNAEKERTLSPSGVTPLAPRPRIRAGPAAKSLHSRAAILLGIQLTIVMLPHSFW